MTYPSAPSAPAIVRPKLIGAIPSPASATDHLLPLAAAWQCDLSDNSLRWTDGVFELFGLPRGTRIDRGEAVEMYCDESRELLERLRANAIATRGSFTFEAQIQRLDGELRWMRVTADVVSSNGRATHLYGHKYDITHEIA
jgi:PAS domain-containing protein